MEKKTIFGIKGPAWFSSLRHYDMIRGMGIDYMHGVLLGIMKMLLSLWFDPVHNNEDFSISSKLDEVDERLLSIKPPASITRCPRSLSDRKHWKASELRSFLLFYSVPCLLNILPKLYLEHFVLLSEAIYILLQESISQGEISHAENLLIHFCLMMESLYGRRRLTANCHYLLHLADDVRDLGPLWTHSCFHFEDKNGFLLKLLHGTQKTEFQVVTAISLIQRIPEMASCLNPGSIAEKFYLTLQNISSPTREIVIEPNIYVLGAVQKYTLNEKEYAALTDALQGSLPVGNEVVRSLRIRIGREVYHSESYTRVIRRNNCFIQYLDKTGQVSFAQIKFFFQHTSDQFDVSGNEIILNFAMTYKLERLSEMLVHDEITKSTARQFIPINLSADEKLFCIPISKILNKCIPIVFKESKDKGYIVPFPNNCEKD
ncbi:uncharacterized protein LOC114576631 [Exaiptasia diaphana]|uniref:Uncharacterized protein n=1 Tax=Exaiptasia diaphana TaxID=2652724 RepID=A0A913YZD1_EXADI|nr:uncharacterized protein LOC114576631 [Exaiptasia diaphana]